MQETVNEKISVITIYSRQKSITIPKIIRWQAKNYKITKLAYHHKIRQGRNIAHIFHVTDGNIDFRLRFDTESLIWTLEEIYSD